MPCRSDYSDLGSSGDDDEDEEDEDEISVQEVLAMPKSQVLRVARDFDLDLPEKILRGPLKAIRQYVIDHIFTDEAIAGAIEFGNRPVEDIEVADVTTREMLVEYLRQPDRGNDLDLIFKGFPVLAKMKNEVDLMAPMLCSVCRLLELHDIPIPETVNEWWENHKIEDRKRVEGRVQELRRQLIDAERAREELEQLVGKPKIVRTIRRIRVPR
jgi:hypothetical protein